MKFLLYKFMVRHVQCSVFRIKHFGLELRNNSNFSAVLKHLGNCSNFKLMNKFELIEYEYEYFITPVLKKLCIWENLHIFYHL